MDATFKSGLDVIYLTSCAIHGIAPDEDVIRNMDLEAAYNQAKRHKMLSVTGMALEPLCDKLDKTLLAKWRIAINQAVKSSFLFSIEREKLYRFMDENEISYLPLKGIILQNAYPKIGMRQMGDNDILIDINKRHLVRDYMKNNDYEIEQYGKAAHDVYMKAPIFNFEIHVYLVTEGLNSVIYNYYLDVWQRLKRENDNSYRFNFTNEDFYIFTIVHAYKHFCYGGIGIKPLADIFVYLKKYGDVLNRKYLDDEFKKIDLLPFEENMRSLANKIFDIKSSDMENITEKLNEKETELLKFFIDSGNFGKKEVLYEALIGRFANEEGEITTGSKFKYLLSRVFPTGVYIKENYPFFHKFKILIPFLWIYRLASRMIKNPKHIRHIKKELKFLNKQK